jgi:hypothetical protein
MHRQFLHQDNYCKVAISTDSFPRSAPMNQFRFIQTNDRFSQRIMITIVTAAH